MTSALVPSNRPWIGIETVALLSLASNAFGQQLTLFPLRSTPLGSSGAAVGETMMTRVGHGLTLFARRLRITL